jgi:drug/metabolite transporter (DMT)-like permease
MLRAIPGEVYALLAALTWALALVLFRQSGQQVSAVAMNLFKNVVALLLLGLTLALHPPGLEIAPEHLGRDLLLLSLSGIVGIALADTAFFYALRLVGVGIISIVDCLYTPFVMIFSWLLLGERLVAIQYLGAGLILGGILISSRHTPPEGRSRAQLLAGIAIAALSMALMAWGIVVVKPQLERWPTIPATAVRMLAGTLVLAALTPGLSRPREVWIVFRPGPVWKTLLPGSLLGAYLALIFWIAGFQYTREASVAAVLNQTTVIFSILLATIVLREPLGGRKLAAVVLAVVGVVIVTLGPRIMA